MLKETMILTSGNKIPKIGLGVWMIPDEVVSDAIVNAVKLGYRHIDTAQVYYNEEGVGKGIKACKIPREELFITSKVAAEIKNYQNAKISIDESLKKLGLDYVDLMLIHCPQPWAEFRGKKSYFKENIEVWRALEEAYKDGKVKSIGVSNFLIDDLQNIMTNCEIKPMVNQIEIHIGMTPLDVINFCQENGIVVEAYSPIAHGKALENELIKAMAKKYCVTVTQLCVRYTLQLDTISLPKSVNPDHMKENADVNFTISENDMDKLKAIVWTK